jgi:hypothetical protein
MKRIISYLYAHRFDLAFSVAVAGCFSLVVLHFIR